MKPLKQHQGVTVASGRLVKTHKLSAMALAIAVANAGMTGTAHSQENEEGIEEIVVRGNVNFFRPTDASSATKFNLPVQETPQAISILTGDILDTFGTKDLMDTQKFIAGVNSSGNGASTNFFLGHMQARGFVLDSLSGYKINGFSTFREFQPDLVAVDRVELLKGPSSVVYGVNNYGGTIITHLKTPQATPGTTLTAETGSYGSYRISADTTGPLNEDGSVRYRLSTAYDDRKSIKDDFRFERVPVYGRLEWDITPQTTLDTYVFYQEEDAVDDFGLMALGMPDGSIVEPFDIDREIFMGSSDYNKIERESVQGYASLKHTLANDLSVEGKFGYSENTNGYQAIYVYTYGYFATPFTDVYTKVDERNIKSWDAELSFGGDFDLFDQTHTFMTLLEYRNIDFDFTSFPFDYLGSVNQFDPDFDALLPNLNPNILLVSNGGRTEDQDRFAVAGQLLLRASDRFSVLLGLRWDDVDQSVRDIQFDPDPDDGVIFNERNLHSQTRKKQLTFRGGLVYALTPEINTYLNYSEGFLPQEGITRNGDNIDPEEGVQWEVGLKGEFYGGRLGASLAVFLIDREKVAISDPTNNPTLQEDFRVTGGEQEHKGFEVEVMGEIAEGLNIVATYAALDTEILKESAGLLPGDSSLGNSVIGAPEKSGSLFLEYTVGEGLLQQTSFSAGVSYVGERPTQQQNLVGEYAYDIGFPIVFLEEYRTVDLGVSYFGLQNFVFSLRAKNVTDEDYFNAAELPSDCCAVNFLQRGASREFTFGMSYQF